MLTLLKALNVPIIQTKRMELTVDFIYMVLLIIYQINKYLVKQMTSLIPAISLTKKYVSITYK